MTAPVRVGVLFGGRSAEHDVSCASALGVVRALHGERYLPVPIGITREGTFRLVPDDIVQKLREQPPTARAIDDHLEVLGPDVELRRGSAPGRVAVSAAGSPDSVLAELDFVFPVLHGPFGEDGVIQGFLELLVVPYAGCGVVASAVGMDKVAMKRAFAAERIPITPHVWFDEHRWRTAGDPAALVAGLRRPLFVKPANMGSSIGISRVADGDDLTAAVEAALAHDAVVLVEQGIAGREVECAVLGGFRPAASLVGEVRVTGGWFDFDQKYFGDADPMIVPAVLPDEVTEQIRELSVRAFQAVGCWGLARVDFLYDEAAGRVYVNEVNTMPGFTAHSMYPKVWAAAGVGYRDLVAHLVELGFERHALRHRGAA
jgi:D-alanine--D-alanine ligase